MTVKGTMTAMEEMITETMRLAVMRMKAIMKTAMEEMITETMRLAVMTMKAMMKTVMEETVTQAAVQKTKNEGWSTPCS